MVAPLVQRFAEPPHWSAVAAKDERGIVFAKEIGAKALSLRPTIDECGPSDIEAVEGYVREMHEATKYLRPSGQRVVRMALETAFLAHRGQLRRSGEAFVTHPVAVALVLAQAEMDRDTVVAGLLHDTVEDTALSFEEVEALFGATVRNIVEGETKISKLVTSRRFSYKEEQTENMRSMFIAMAEDWRIVVVKLADRLHNMRTLDFMPPEKRRSISRETLEIFAPLAHRLGMWPYKTELEETAFRHLYPEEYEKLSSAIHEKLDSVDGLLSQAKADLEELLNGDEWLMSRMRNVAVAGRVKSTYSTWKKMKRHRCGLERIDDLLALRVVLWVEEDETAVSHCYHVLGKVHGRWTPLLKTLKDYISSPKPNGYRSLHTTVLVDSQPVEIQIRTKLMHRVAELGAAAHWAYKDENASQPWLQIVRRVKQWEPLEASTFMCLVRSELLGTRVFVFAPQGKILNLAKGATLKDAVARLDPRLRLGACINGLPAKPDAKLHNGDIVGFHHSNDLYSPPPLPPLDVCQACVPLPGDALLVDHHNTLHRTNCFVGGPHLSDLDPPSVKAAFERHATIAPDGSRLGFPTSFVVFCRDRTKMLLDLSLPISQCNIVDVMSETKSPRGLAAFQYTIHVDDKAHLDSLFAKLSAVPDVIHIVRGTIDQLKDCHSEAGFWKLPSAALRPEPLAPPVATTRQR